MDPRSLLDRWKGPRPASPSLKSALDDLGRLRLARPELTDPSLTLEALLVAAFDDADPAQVPSFDREAIEANWLAGSPAFPAWNPPLHRATLVRRFENVVQVLGQTSKASRMLAFAIRNRSFRLMDWVEEVLKGRAEGVASLSEAHHLDPLLTASVLRMTLLPSLARVSAELDLIRGEGTWTRGDCPHCGSRPLLTESRGLEQRIYHRCGLCAASWPGERLRCPSCSETSSKALHYSFVEGEQDRYRLAHCDACLYDWKVVSTLTALTPPAMIVADLATVHLDLLAEARREESSA